MTLYLDNASARTTNPQNCTEISTLKVCGDQVEPFGPSPIFPELAKFVVYQELSLLINVQYALEGDLQETIRTPSRLNFQS